MHQADTTDGAAPAARKSRKAASATVVSSLEASAAQAAPARVAVAAGHGGEDTISMANTPGWTYPQVRLDSRSSQCDPMAGESADP